MNKPSTALTVSETDDRLLDLLASRVTTQLKADYEVADNIEAPLNLRILWSAFYRNRWLIAAVLGVALSLGVVSVLLSTPRYQATATVQIDQQSAKVLGTEDTEPLLQAQEADRFLQTEADIIGSRALAARVASDLRLNGNPSFLKAMGERPLPPGSSPNEVKEQTLSALQGNLDISLPRNSRIVGIAVESRDPELAARIANSFAQNFITSNLQRKFDTSSYSREFLDKQLASTKTKLENSERALIGYSRAAGLIDASNGSPTVANSTATGPRSLTTSDLVQLNDAYSQARADRVQKEERWKEARAIPVMSLPEVLANPTIQALSQKRAEAQAVYEQDVQRYKAGHPIVAQAQAQIGELERQITTFASSIRDSIRDQYVVAARQEQALAANVSALKGETLAEQDRSVQYNILKREVDTNRELYDALLQRYNELSAESGVTANNISIIDSADPPLRPVSPRPLINMSLAGFVGLGFAFLLVFARERFDDAIRVPEDVDEKLHLPLIGVIPMVSGNETPQSAIENARSAMSEAYEAARSAIELSSTAGVPRTLLLTSSREAEGKSTTAFALARDLASSGQRVLLVDADMRNPSLHRLIGTANSSGLSNVLARQKSLIDVVLDSKMPGLQFLPSGPVPPSPAQLLATSSISDLFTSLLDQYDAIIVDGPPVLGLADAPRLAASVEAVVFVVEASGAHRGYAKSALRRLLRVRANLLGAILTKFDSKKSGFGEMYGYYSYDYAPPLADDRAATAVLDRLPSAA